MLSKITRLGYANITLALVLVLAMTGGAYAASKYIITSTKQISPKVLKQLEGKAGSAGPAGLNGKDGAAGVAGEKGIQGDKGAAGESVVAKEIKVGEPACGLLGGGEFKVGATTTFACNGKEGQEGSVGKEGTPWTAGGVLPSGKTETGVWALGFASVPTITAISFNIRLTKAVTMAHGHFVTKATTECPGTSSEPSATAGNLCVYSSALAGEFAEFFELAPGASAGVAGSAMIFIPNAKGELSGFGSWAVTAS